MSTDNILTLAVLGITLLLFVREWLRVDVVALCVSCPAPTTVSLNRHALGI